MSTFTAVPIYRKENLKYNAPAFQVEANDANEAKDIASKKSGLGRFDEWNFHVIETSKIKKSYANKVKRPKADPNSKSQLGKSIAGHGHTNSRPVRRGLRRLAIASGSTEKGCKKAGSIKMW